MKIDKRLLGICEIASKESARPQLASVRFEENKIIATDGYRLLIIQQEDIEDNQLPELPGFKYVSVNDISLPASTLSRFVKDIKINKTLDVLSLGWSVGNDNGVVSLATTDLDTSTIKQMKATEGEYPRYQKIVDSAMEKKPVVEIGVDIKLLLGLLEAMLKAGAVQQSMVFRITGQLDPLVVKAKDSKGREIFGLVMPVRINV